jgi:hypothetical protein
MRPSAEEHTRSRSRHHIPDPEAAERRDPSRSWSVGAGDRRPAGTRRHGQGSPLSFRRLSSCSSSSSLHTLGGSKGKEKELVYGMNTHGSCISGFFLGEKPAVRGMGIAAARWRASHGWSHACADRQAPSIGTWEDDMTLHPLLAVIKILNSC